MHETNDGYLDNKELTELAFSYNSDISTLRSIVKTCIEIGLFIETDQGITTKRVQEQKEFRAERSAAGKKGMSSRYQKDNSVTTQLQLSNNNKSNEIKSNKKILDSNSATKRQLSDENFITKIQQAYSWIDVNTELKKMDVWLMTRPGRQKTKRFIVNWLNKIDKPIGSSGGYRKP